jgi:hypothetical protein
VNVADIYNTNAIQIGIFFMFKSETDIFQETNSSVKFEFLGTLAGREAFVKSFRESTYARIYKSCGFSDDNRYTLSNAANGLAYKKLGEHYSVISDEQKLDYNEHRPFGPRNIKDIDDLGYTRGGGFFLTVKDLAVEGERDINCFGYALSTFGEKLVALSGKSSEELIKSAKNNHGMRAIVSDYFTCIAEFPKDGDLAIYQTTKCIKSPGFFTIAPGDITHAGIFRNSKPNWNSPSGGTIESKWGWLSNPYVFQHDVFFTPEFYGDLVTFYRPK